MGRLVVVPKDFEIKCRIVDGVDRPIEELTVDAICRNSGVSRPTFYRHFGSKFDLSSWYAKFVGEFYLDQIGRTYSWEEGLTEHFLLLYEKRDLFYFGAESSQNIYLSETVRRPLPPWSSMSRATFFWKQAWRAVGCATVWTAIPKSWGFI